MASHNKALNFIEYERKYSVYQGITAILAFACFVLCGFSLVETMNFQGCYPSAE